eukprot:gene229-biopygen13297
MWGQDLLEREMLGSGNLKGPNPFQDLWCSRSHGELQANPGLFPGAGQCRRPSIVLRARRRGDLVDELDARAREVADGDADDLDAGRLQRLRLLKGVNKGLARCSAFAVCVGSGTGFFPEAGLWNIESHALLRTFVKQINASPGDEGSSKRAGEAGSSRRERSNHFGNDAETQAPSHPGVPEALISNGGYSETHCPSEFDYE